MSKIKAVFPQYSPFAIKRGLLDVSENINVFPQLRTLGEGAEKLCSFPEHSCSSGRIISSSSHAT
jgi:hypothetical protein